MDRDHAALRRAIGRAARALATLKPRPAMAPRNPAARVRHAPGIADAVHQLRAIIRLTTHLRQSVLRDAQALVILEGALDRLRRTLASRLGGTLLVA